MNALVLLVKTPRAGAVKTRLAASLGADGPAWSAMLYRAFVFDMVAALEKTPAKLFIALDANGPEDEALWGEDAEGWNVFPQIAGGLGERMTQAFRRMFAEGFERVVVLGSDMPDLNPAIPQAALAALDEHDAVIAPAIDGGYGLIGFHSRSFNPDVFTGVRFSRDDVFAVQSGRLAALGLGFKTLSAAADIDEAADLLRLSARLSVDPTAAPRTRLLLNLLRDAGKTPFSRLNLARAS